MLRRHLKKHVCLEGGGGGGGGEGTTINLLPPPLPFSLNVMYGHPPPPPLSFSPVPDKEERDKNQPIIKNFHTSIGQKLEKKYLFWGGNEYLVIFVPKAKPRAPLMSILLLLLVVL